MQLLPKRARLCPALGEVAEWQTRMVQVHVPARAWGFNSPLPHQIADPRCRRAGGQTVPGGYAARVPAAQPQEFS